MHKPRLLDLYCGAGGAAMGYSRAGFEVVGVDIRPMPHYPFQFHQADALEYCAEHGKEFDVIHASPPCQAYSVTAPLSDGQHPMLIAETRTMVSATGKPFVIENVEGAKRHLINALMLCGTMFGLKVLRHRLFETQPVIWWPPLSCSHNGKASGNRSRRAGISRTPSCALDGYEFVTVAGNNYLMCEGAPAMGIDWMTKAELTQAIPPAYTEFIGRQLLEALKVIE
jgi:DNA (cytosine-5)-methyltransferase 1